MISRFQFRVKDRPRHFKTGEGKESWVTSVHWRHLTGRLCRGVAVKHTHGTTDGDD